VKINHTPPCSIFVLGLHMRLCTGIFSRVLTTVKLLSSISMNDSASLAAVQESQLPEQQLALPTTMSEI